MDNIEKSYGLDRYNILDYLKKHNRRYAPIPDHILNCIKEEVKDQKQAISTYIGVYIILYLFQDDYNNSDLTMRDKSSQFFGLGYETTKKILDKLENIGVIVQKREHRKKIIIVKYPEYVNDTGIKSIEFTEKIIEKTVKVNYNEDNESNEEQNNIENFLNDYINWKNSKETIIKNPAGFKKAYYKNPADFDFSDYKEYQDKKKQKKLIEQRKKEKLKKDIEKEKEEEKKKEERIRIYEKIKNLKENDKALYSKLYEKAEKQAIQDDPDSKHMDKHMFDIRVRNVYLPEIIKDEGLI